VHTSAASVQAERSGRRSSPPLIRGFGVQVPGSAPVMTCEDVSFLDRLTPDSWNEMWSAVSLYRTPRLHSKAHWPSPSVATGFARVPELSGVAVPGPLADRLAFDVV
jgi:hypothetical protein